MSLRHLLLSAAFAIGIGITDAQAASGTVFPSANDGIEQFVAAARAKDMAALDKILGPDGRDVLHSGDNQADQNALERFVTAYDARHKLTEDSATRASLSVGTD